MAEEFDLIEAFISVSIRKQSLDQVEAQIAEIAGKLKELKAAVGMRLSGEAKFKKDLESFLAQLPPSDVKVVPVIGNVDDFKKSLEEFAKNASKGGIKIKVTADTKDAQNAVKKVTDGAKKTSEKTQKAAGSIEYLRLQVERWGRLNGRLAESRRLLAEIDRPGFGSKAQMEDIRSQMSYYDRLRNQAAKIADLSDQVSEWGKLPGRLQKSQQLLADIGKEGFGSPQDFKSVTRQMAALDGAIANQSRKVSARAYVNQWGALSGKLKEANSIIQLIDQSDIFSKEDLATVRQMTKEIDKVAAAAAKLNAGKIDPNFVPMKDLVTSAKVLQSRNRENEKIQKAEKARQSRARSALRSVFFEAGFVAGPATAVIGNIIGVNNQVRAFVANSGTAARVAKRFGVDISTLGKFAGTAASGLTVLAGAVFKLLSVSFGIVSQFAQQAIGALAEGFKAVIGPALALFQAIRGIAAYLPLVATGIAVLVGETLTKATVEFDKIQSLFKFTFADQAASQLNLVRQVSDAFGLSLDALAVGYGKLAAAAKDSGVTQEEIRQLFIGTSSAAAVFKLNQGDLDGVFRAYQQIISKSVVSSEELRQQLSERLPAAFSLAAKSLGKSQQDLNEALANGSVTAEEFIPAFGRALRQAYDQNTSGIVDELPAKLNRLQNSLLDLQRSAEGTDFLEAFVDLKQGLIEPFIKEGAIKDALKNVFVEAGKAFRFFTAQIPLAIDLLKNVWEAVRPLVEAFATLQLVFSALAIAAAKELAQVDRITEVTFGRSVATIKEFSQRVTKALNLDLSDFTSIMAFVDAIIRRSDLALAAFIATLEAAIKAILVFATTLYAALIPVMLNLGVQLGKSIAEGIFKGLAGDSERGAIEREIAQIDAALKNPNRIGGGYGTVNIPSDNGATIRRREELIAKIANLDKEASPEGIAKSALISLDTALKSGLQQFQSPELFKIFDELGASVRESYKNLLPVTEQAKRDLSFLGIPLTDPRASLATSSASAANVESQFFGFEEFQKFLQSGTNEQVRVAENTQKIYEVGQQQLDVLNKLNMGQQATNNLLNLDGGSIHRWSPLRWEN